MSNIIEFAEKLREVIEAGQTVVEGNVIKIISDNGTDIANAVKTPVTGGNGTASNVYSMTGKVVEGEAVTTGWALLAMDLGTVGAAIAPCLGVLAGTGLYALAPEFWTNVSNTLFNAGKTLGGKVIAYFNGHNIGFDATTINIFKDALVEIDFFQYSDEVEAPPEWLMSTPIYSADNVFRHQYITQSRYQQDETITFHGGVKVAIAQSIESPFNYYSVYASTDPADKTYTYTRVQTDTVTGQVLTTEGVETITLDHSFEFDNKTVYYRLYTRGDADTYLIPSLSADNDLEKLAWSIVYGQITPGNGENLQPGADYPNEEPIGPYYPDWPSWPYPETIDPSEMPDIKPTKYPEIDPDPYPGQEGAQDPENEPDDEIIPEIIEDTELPDPDPEYDPDGDESEDEDESEEDEEIEFDPDVPTPPDPPDPDPGEDTSDPVPDSDTPSSVHSNSLFTVYNPSLTQLNALGGYLWDDNLMEIIKKIWQNPLDGIISLIQVYTTPSTGGSQNIILGYLDSGVSAPVVSSQFKTINCGTINLNEKKKNATDYSPYSSLHLFLPFIGIVELDINECMGGSITVKYKVDVYTGTCLAEVKITRAKDMPDGNVLYTFSGNASQQIPLTSGNATGALNALIGGVTAGLSVASGGGLGIVGGAAIAGRSLTHEMFHVAHSGNISANAGIMGGKKPFLIIGRRKSYDAANYNTIYGYPSNKNIVLGNHSGYCRVKECRLKTNATKPEHDEIIQLLKDGIIL